MKHLLFFILILQFSLFLTGVRAQNIHASAQLDTNNLQIGDQTTLHLNVVCKPGVKIRWPLINDTIVRNVEILSRTPIDTSVVDKEGNIQYHQAFLITSFDSGYYAIPPFEYSYRIQGDSTLQFAETDPILLSVHTVEVDTTQAIKPIKAPLKVPLTFMEILPYMLAYIFLGILVPGIYYYRKRDQEPGFIFSKKPKIPAHIVALQDLDRLRKEKLWQAGKVKEYHSKLTDIIRVYIESRFHVPAIELTTSEILESFKKVDLDVDLKMKLQMMLELADLVKFAKAQPLPDQHGQSLDDAVYFVEKTIPVFQPQELINGKDEIGQEVKQLSANNINVEEK